MSHRTTIWGEVESSTANPVMRPVVVRQPMSTGHTAYHHVGHTAYHHVGLDPATGQLLGVAAMGAAAFHGYRRYRSMGWALAFALFAGLNPWITLGVAVGQGFAKRKGR